MRHHNTRRTLVHLLLLVTACLVCYFVGLTDHGLMNTQESMRLTAAREMQARGDLILPTLDGEPYIAKPPAMYWMMIASAELRGGRVDLFDLRFTVALGGLLGVIATYFAGRVLLRDPDDPDMGPRAAFYAAMGLAGGVLYARSSRIGELDILLIPTIVTAMACIGAAWRSHAEHRKTLWWAVILAAICSALAALTKGPIPTAVIGIGGYGAILAESVFCDMERSRAHTVAARILAPAAALATMLVSVPQVEGLEDAAGVAFHALVAGLLAWGVVRLTEPARAKRWLGALSRTHPVIVLGAGVASLWWWISAYRLRAHPGLLALLESDQVADNLRLLVPVSPVRNLGFLAYGVGAASIGCMIALYWIARDRPSMTKGRILTLGWLLLGLLVFSTMGKGVARYVVPLLPAASLLAGWWLVCAIRDIPQTAAGARTWRVVVGVILGAQIAGITWWYADGRDRFSNDRSPRDFVRAMLEDRAVDPLRVGSFGFETPALDFYLGLETHTGERADYWAKNAAYDRLATPIDHPENGLFQRLDREPPEAGPYWLLALDGTAAVKRRAGDVRAMLDAAQIPWTEAPIEALPGWCRPPRETPVRLLTLHPDRPRSGVRESP